MTADSSARQEAVPYQLASMCKFARPDDLPGAVIDHCQSRRFASRINFDPQWRDLSVRNRMLEDDREQIAA
jgi:hypothetical protein